MIVFGQIGEEHIGFDGQVDGSQRGFEVCLDGDDGRLVGQYLPVAVGCCLADVGGNLVFVGTDQEDDSHFAFGERVLSFCVSCVVAGKDEPAVAEVTVVAHLDRRQSGLGHHRFELVGHRGAIATIEYQEMLDGREGRQGCSGMVEFVLVAMRRLEIEGQLIAGRLAREGFVKQGFPIELLRAGDETVGEDAGRRELTYLFIRLFSNFDI